MEQEVFKMKQCPICGKNFIYYPSYIYKIRIKDHYTRVCSWKCQREWEKCGQVLKLKQDKD